jgi:uncharacterized protein
MSMLSTFTLVFAAGSTLVAAFVRGYSGFGFSMISIMLLSLCLPPAEIVPPILCLEVAASIWLLPQVWKDVHWRSLLWLSMGVILTTPIGAYLLAATPQKPMRIGIAAAVLAFAVLLRRGFTLKRMPNRGWTVLVGMATGLLNGAAALGGPPVILFYFSSPAGAGVSRASLIAYFFFTDILAIGANAAGGLVTMNTALFGGAMLLPLIAGLIIGSRTFSRADPESFRKTVLAFLMILSFAGILRAFM